MDVKVLAYTKSSGNVRIERISDGQIFNVKIDLFDPESQKKIVEAAPVAKAELEIKVSAGRRRERLGESSFMKKQTVSASLKVLNDSRDIDFADGKATVFLVGRQTKRFAERDQDYGKVLGKNEFKLSVNAGRETEFECKPVVTEYDSDKDDTNVGGWEYYGYLVVIQNADGSVHSVDTSIGNLKKEVEEAPAIGKSFLSLNEGSLVEKDLAQRSKN